MASSRYGMTQKSLSQAYAQVQQAMGAYSFGPPSLGVPTGAIRPGTRVKLSRNSQYYYQAPDVPGVVQSADPMSATVQFDNGYTNIYDSSDLELIKEAKVTTKKEIKPKISLDSVILSKDKKEQIKAAISQVGKEDQIFDEWGFGDVFEKGTAVSMLFWGIPGTGKTLMAEAISETLGMKLAKYGPAEIESSEPGGAERTIKSIFRNCKDQVVLFDECDSLLMSREEVGPIMSQLINTLLSEMETFKGVIIFTTNRMGKLDAALERRLTTKIEFPFPDKESRLMIWKRMIPGKAPLSRDVNLGKLAEYPFAGGNIKNIVLNAVRIAVYQKANKIEQKFFLDSIVREAEALEAFKREYEKNPHQQVVTGMTMGEGKMQIRKGVNGA